MKLSICIPTYNRCFFLIDAIKDTIRQAEYDGLLNEIEFCISDNCSTDNTKDELQKLVLEYPNVSIKLNFNHENIGPDKNFLKVMPMASGVYSILKGDDDYFKAGALKYLFSQFESHPEVGLFISDADMVDLERNYVGTVKYLREDYEELIVDFTKEEEARSYFTLCNCVHALGSFMSGVVFKTEANNYKFDESFLGTAYAFEFFFWKYLLDGNKLMYTNHKFIDAVVGTTNVWSTGVARNALDIHGFAFIGHYFFEDTRLLQDFLNVVNRMYPDYRYIPIDQKKAFNEKLYPALLESNHPMRCNIKRSSNIWGNLGFALLCLLPSSFISHILAIFRKAK